MDTNSDFIVPKQHPTLEKLRWRRFAYWAVVTSLATLVFLTITCALFSRNFKTTATLTLPTSSTAEALQPAVVAAIKQLNSDDSLAALLNPHGTVADTTRLQEVRQQLAYSLAPLPQTSGVALQVVYAGVGSRREREFIERFTQALAQHLRPSAWSDGQASMAQPNQGTSWEPVRRNLAATFESLEQQVAKIATAKQALQELMQEHRLGGDLSQRRDLSFEIDQLQNHKAELLSKYTVTHPSVVEIQKRIELLNVELENLEIAQGSDTPYRAASFQRTADSTAWLDIAAKVNEIDLSKVQGSLIQVEQIWNQLELELQANPMATAATVVPAGIESEPRIQSIPAGPVGQRYFPVVITMLSLGLGVLLATVASRRLIDRGYDSAEEMCETLGMPMIGSVTTSKGRRRQALRFDQGLSRLLKMSELVIFTSLLIVLATAIRSPEIRSALIENPILAICQVVWMIRG